MSNLLKSKFLLGVMVVAFMFVGAFAINANTAAADCSITSTLRLGSSGAEVMCLQSIIGATADGSFGPMTKTAVMAFQANHNLTADGVVGPMTRVALMANGAVSGNFPAGCSSAAGFSTTTGLPCNSVASGFPAGCSSAAGFSTTTGMPCSGGNLPAGCSSTAGFSSTTGMSCSGGSSGNTGGLTGGAGSINDINVTTSGTETTVAEGALEKVYAFEIEADDNSDLAITSARVELDVDTDGSTRLDRYADSISIWMGSTKVGSLDASDFSRTAGEHTGTITLKDAVVKKGAKVKFYVGFQAAENIDTDDRGNTIDVFVDSVRYNDASGAILTESGFELGGGDAANVDFEDSTANDDIKLQSSEDDLNAGTLQVDENDTSDDTLAFAFNLKVASDSSDIDVLTLPVDVSITDPSGGVSNATAEKVINDIWLEVDGQTYDDFDASSEVDDAINNTTVTTTYTFNIDEGDLTIDSGDTATVKVFVKFGEQGGDEANYDEGTVVVTSVTADQLEVENSQGDQVDVEGSTDVTGEDQTLQVNGSIITYVSSTSTQAVDTGKIRDYTLVFDVKALGDNIEIDRVLSALDDDNDGSNTGDDVVFTTVTPGSATADSSASLSSTASLNGDTYTVFDGQTKRFTLTVTVSGASATGQYKIILESVGGSPATDVETSSATVVAA